MNRINLRKLTLFSCLTVLGLVLPLFVRSDYWRHVAIVSFYYGLMAASWSFLVGYAGQFSLGHVALAAIGGYTSALTIVRFGFPLPLGLVMGVFLSGLVGWGLGVLCLRFRGAYLALFTVAFAQILQRILNGEEAFTRGARGLHVPPLFAGASKIPYYYLYLVILVLSLVMMYRLVRSRYGLFFRSIREDDQAAAALGVNVVRYKVMAFTISSVFAGVAGVMYAHYVGILTPNITKAVEMAIVMSMGIVGGVENLIAAALSGILLKFGLEYLRAFGAWRLVMFGALLMLTLRFARNGLIDPVLKRIAREEI